MRKLVFILFLAMLPLQWTAAAVAALCLPGAQAAASAQAHASGQSDEIDHARSHALASAGDQASHHHGPQDPGHDGKAQHASQGGCCHATGSVLPTRATSAGLQAALGDLVPRMTVLAVSHSSESLFRPPRLALA